MELKIVLLLNLIAYSFMVSQSFFYIIAMSNTLVNLQAPAYIQLRHLMDKNFKAKFKYPFYATLLFSPATTILAFLKQDYFLLITACIATTGIFIETYITLKKNSPINHFINTWTSESYPSNWQGYRAKWLYYFSVRQKVNITGFVSLLIGVIFH
jgi:uncharacterized membrane protein